MCESESFLSKDEQDLLSEVLRRFELETNFMDAIVFIKDGESYKIIFDYSLVSNSSQDLAYWFYHLDFRNITNINVGEMKGFIDVFKNKYDVVVKVSQNVFVFVSKDRDDDIITKTEELRLKMLGEDIEEITLSAYA